MELIVVEPSGKRVTVEVVLFESVKGLKSLMETSEGYASHKQRLVFRQSLLEDHCSLSEYNLDGGDAIHLFVCSGKSVVAFPWVPFALSVRCSRVRNMAEDRQFLFS